MKKVQCYICDSYFDNDQVLMKHILDTHKVVFVPMDIVDLDKLLHFIFTRDEKFLNPKLIRFMQKLLRAKGIER